MALPRELSDAIDAVAEELEALSREAEVLRRAPDTMGALLKKARIPMAKVPKDVGGYEISPAEQVDFFARLAYLNPTAGWLAFVQNGAAGMVGAGLPDEGIQEVFAEDSPLLAAVAAPTGQSQAVSGGYRINGRWRYVSGAHISEWILLMTIGSDPPGPRMVVLRTEEVELVDDWHVAALQGTGSVDVVADDVFVPEARTLQPAQMLRGGPQYSQLGFKGYVAGENFGFSLGVAQRYLDEMATYARNKKRAADETSVADRAVFQHALASADMMCRATRVHMKYELDRAEALAREMGAPLAAEDMARLEAALSWSTHELVAATVKLFPFAGAGALHLENATQRSLRDLLGSGQHQVVDVHAIEAWGAMLVQ